MADKPSKELTNHSYRCYVEFNERVHRLVFQEICDKSFVKFKKVLSQLREVDGFKDISFVGHSFKYFEGKTDAKWIRSKRFDVKNGSKIRIYLKSAEKSSQTRVETSLKDKPMAKLVSKVDENQIKLRLCFVQTIDATLRQESLPSGAPVDINWRKVSVSMRTQGYHLFSESDAQHHLNAILRQYLIYLSKRVFSKTFHTFCIQIDARKLEMFDILDTICFQPFIRHKTWRSIQRFRDMFAIRETVEWLSTQTVAASGDQQSAKRHVSAIPAVPVMTAPVVSTGRATGNKPKASDGSSSVRSDATKSQSKRNPRKRRDNKSFSELLNQSLVTVVHDLQTISSHIEWTVVSRMLRSKGFYVSDDQYLENKFKELINQYIRAMITWGAEEMDAMKAFPHFQCLHFMDLEPFCRPKTYQLIERLRAKYYTKYDSISVDSQQSSQYYYMKLRQNY